MLGLQRDTGFEYGFTVDTLFGTLSPNYTSHSPDTIFARDRLLPGGMRYTDSSYQLSTHFVVVHTHRGAPNYLSGSDLVVADLDRITVISVDQATNIGCSPIFLF